MLAVQLSGTKSNTSKHSIDTYYSAFLQIYSEKMQKLIQMCPNTLELQSDDLRPSTQ